MSKSHSILLYSLIIITAAATRILPHAWNFAPVTAIAIVAAIYLPVRQALFLTLAVRLVSDVIIGFFAWPLMLAVYAAHLFGVLTGLWIRRNKSFGRIIAAPVVSSLVFFLVTNFAFFYPTYTHDISGVILAYTNGLPFLRGTLLGDVGYTIVFVASFEAVRFYLRHRAACARPGFKIA
ncbi:MAG: hypothetical protein Q8N81_04840 [bacterium]|nr:hypothetical protein [bacterium]